MKKTLTAVGTSLGLIIDKPIADLYGVDRNTMVEVTPEKDGLNIRFLKEEKRVASAEAVEEAAKTVNKKYSRMMKNLAK